MPWNKAKELIGNDQQTLILSYRADWLAWIGMSTSFGSGEGLLRTGIGLSISSLSSIGSSFMTGGCKEPIGASGGPSEPTGLVIGGPPGVPCESWTLGGFCGERDCKCVLLVLLFRVPPLVVLLLFVAMTLTL